RELELEHDRARIRSLDGRDRRVAVLPDAARPLRWEEQLVVGGLDVDCGQRRAVVELDPRADLEGVGQPVGRDLPLAGRVPDDLRIVEGVRLQQGAVERRYQLERGERALLMRIQARWIGADD